MTWKEWKEERVKDEQAERFIKEKEEWRSFPLYYCLPSNEFFLYSLMIGRALTCSLKFIIIIIFVPQIVQMEAK